MRDASAVTVFIAGMLTMGYAVVALFFLKFWRQTRDRLFAFFALAFGLLMVQRFALALGGARVDAVWYYLLRLLAFLVIAFAIMDKNRVTDR
jgi:membrane-associated PAP2 superfamily phosphatase